MRVADLSGFDTAIITINGVEFNVWLAKTPAQHNQGLMFATAQQLAPDAQGRPRGMLFIFAAPTLLSFFMLDTFIPLDLAYARADQTIAELHDLIPQNLTPVMAGEPVQFGLEVLSGTLAANGVGLNDLIDIPPAAFN